MDGVYLQFFFKSGPITQYIVPEILKQQQKYGQNPILGLKDPQDPSKGRKRMVVEFSSPNIAKPFHAGHLRSTIIGGFLSNLYEGAGWDVVRLNYLGDWGKQYGLLALAFERYGDEAALEADPIGHLFELYVKINNELAVEKEEIGRLEQVGNDASKIKEDGLDEQARRYFKAMCDNDAKAIKTWKRFRELSISKYEKSYARLNIRFDEYSGESKVNPESMANVEKELEEKGLSEPSDGAVIMDFTKHVPGKLGKTLGKALLRKRDGTSLYLTRDIGGLLERSAKYNFDQMIYVIGSDQDTHVKQFFKIIELTGHKELHAKISHVSFGRVQGMSTRKGTVIFLDDILRDVGDKMHEVMKKNEAKYQQVVDPEKTADILGISSVMVQDMSGKMYRFPCSVSIASFRTFVDPWLFGWLMIALVHRINSYTFNMDAMTSFEGDTGPYLQYAHARLCSIVRKVDPDAALDLSSAQTELLVEPHAIDLVRLIARYPDTIQNTLKSHEPITVLTYLFRMTHALSSSYDVLKVAGSEPELMKARLALYSATRMVLDNGMRLLGLTPVDR